MIHLPLKILNFPVVAYKVQSTTIGVVYRHAKRLNFDTSGFLEDPKLTQKQRDLQQN